MAHQFRESRLGPECLQPRLGTLIQHVYTAKGQGYPWETGGHGEGALIQDGIKPGKGIGRIAQLGGHFRPELKLWESRQHHRFCRIANVKGNDVIGHNTVPARVKSGSNSGLAIPLPAHKGDSAAVHDDSAGMNRQQSALVKQNAKGNTQNDEGYRLFCPWSRGIDNDLLSASHQVSPTFFPEETRLVGCCIKATLRGSSLLRRAIYLAQADKDIRFRLGGSRQRPKQRQVRVHTETID